MKKTALLGALALAGCTVSPAYSTVRGALKAEIKGQPFATPTDPEQIAAGLRLPSWFNPKRITTRPIPETYDNLRLVLVFNPGFNGPGDDRACQDFAGLPVAPPGETLRLTADFCYNGRSLTRLTAATPAPSGPDDPRFRQAMAEVLANLLPPVDQLERERGSHFPL
jgi:hypothetical protein